MNTNYTDLVIDCLSAVNGDLPTDLRVVVSRHTIVAGDKSEIDSLSTINLAVAIEEAIQEKLSLRIDIIDDGLMAEGGPPFETVEQLGLWLEQVLA